MLAEHRQFHSANDRDAARSSNVVCLRRCAGNGDIAWPMVVSIPRLIACAMFLAGAYLAAGARADDRAGESTKVKPFFQELFLGELVYPQEQGEIQFTTGFLTATETKHDSRLPVIIEYGITDRLQIAVGLPIDFQQGQESADGVGNIELEGFWNFYNDAQSGWAAGIGFGLGLPAATPDVGDRALLYEPFLAACRQFDNLDFNASAGLEIKDFLDDAQPTEVNGVMALAAFRRFDRLIPLIELRVELEASGTPVRLAPGLIWQPPATSAELGISFPVGLTDDAPDFAVFFLATIELETRRRKPSDHDDDNASESPRPQARYTSPAAGLPRPDAFEAP